ncbi:hypothetical protein I8J29_32790 [Paenibacillus sp. MWE-103]|uniref:Uncharacterized protein n=1 Tax=Paenibacillus artemisiicola TaxID=1172618 RepID=A0ABS3WKV0_9BACL|nr:hypothetical protein [Paenibacillus artemisiicola]MBO7748951.1 hypothetical protein [Paenibacillus artemisiicola]
MPSFSTGAMPNPDPDPAVSLQLLITNEDPATEAVIELEAFLVPTAPDDAYVPAAHQLFSLAPLSATLRTINIAGFPAYEARFNVTGANVVVDLFAIDEAGGLNAVRRALLAEQPSGSANAPLP